MEYDKLKLDNQICFPVYAASRLITREYQPYLDKLQITYPQYLVLLILWEKDAQSVNEIAKTLILNTNTITPLLKRMEQQGLISRERSKNDERKVIVLLTPKGLKLKEQALLIPEKLGEHLLSSNLKIDDLISLKENLNTIIQFLSE